MVILKTIISKTEFYAYDGVLNDNVLLKKNTNLWLKKVCYP